jgi:hypothetical protein
MVVLLINESFVMNSLVFSLEVIVLILEEVFVRKFLILE